MYKCLYNSPRPIVLLYANVSANCNKYRIKLVKPRKLYSSWFSRLLGAGFFHIWTHKLSRYWRDAYFLCFIFLKKMKGGVGLLLPLGSRDWLMICPWGECHPPPPLIFYFLFFLRVIWWLSIWRWGGVGGVPPTQGVPPTPPPISFQSDMMVVNMAVEGSWRSNRSFKVCVNRKGVMKHSFLTKTVSLV